jgi:pyruvate/2-oxoglutarate dehydrogenase complex dihydrolipoamide dehydrogenase (E3) component
MTKTISPDICVIGAGSGGLSVAAAAAAFGVSVVLVEKGKMGGDCLNYGCVPSKALIAAGKHAHAMRESGAFGILPVDPKVDFGKVNRHVHSVIEAIAPNDSVERFTALGVRVIEAAAHFVDGRTVAAGDWIIKARRFVVATGSSAAIPSIDGLSDVDFLTNETIFDLTRKPAHLVILGAGPIGMELAQAHRRLGCEVTVLEAGTALSREDPEMSAPVLRQLRAEGVSILEGNAVTSLARRGRTGIRVTIGNDEASTTVDGSHLLVATGRKPNVEGLGLEAAGIAFDRNGIRVDDRLRTSNRRVFAIGDVAGQGQFTHLAGYHAGLVVRAILFRLRARTRPQIVPRVTFTDPEIAQVGLSEGAAREAHKHINVLRWPLAENDRAQAERRTEGLVKLIADRKGRILGASIVGHGAGEMIAIWALAIERNLKLRDMTGYIAPYPTMGEIGKRAAVSYFVPATRKPWVRRIVRLLRLLG